jgi:hypothetical protein
MKGIKAKHPLRSEIYNTIKGRNPSMPENPYPKLSSSDVNMIKLWINMELVIPLIAGPVTPLMPGTPRELKGLCKVGALDVIIPATAVETLICPITVDL